MQNLQQPDLQRIELTDAATGSRAKILAGFGFNCYSFEPVVDGERIETLWSAPDFEAGTARPSGSGIPILFPFAGRMRGTKFEFNGKEYNLPPGDALGNAI